MRLCSILLAGIAAMVLLACTPAENAEVETYPAINGIRAQAGLPPLVADAQLVRIARARSVDMASKHYFSHYPLDGCNFICLMDNEHVAHAYSAENIAWNTWDWNQTASVAVRMWNASPGHLANILGCHFERFGTGVARAADGTVYFTMIFEGNRVC